MEKKNGITADASAAPIDPHEVLVTVLEIVLPHRVVDAARGTTFDFPTGMSVVWAEKIERGLFQRGYEIARESDRIRSSDALEALLETARRDERRRLAASIESARMAALIEYEQLAKVGDLDGLYVEIHAKYFDALTEKLARGER